MSEFLTLAEGARAILLETDALAKAALARRVYEAWQAGNITEVGKSEAPARPGRPARPDLRPPRDVPRRRIGKGTEGRIALLHALAHIELNAVDLAVDILIRFPQEEMPHAFYEDWLKVAAEEGKHFQLLAARLAELEAAYGDLPAHDGLWQAAQETSGDLLARLAVVPLVLEARGLDVTPTMISKLELVEDEESAAVLRIIYQDEIGHVAIGKRWFDHVASARQLDPKEAWQAAVKRHFRGAIKPPFNEPARSDAGFPEDFYLPLAEAFKTG